MAISIFKEYFLGRTSFSPQKSICGSDVVLPQCHCMKRHFVANWSKTVEAEKICAIPKRQKLPVIVTKLLPAGLADAINPLCIALIAGWWLTTKSKCVRGTKQRSSWVGELYVGSEPLLKSTFSYWSLHLRLENQFYYLMPHNCPLESGPLWSKLCTTWPTRGLRLKRRSLVTLFHPHYEKCVCGRGSYNSALAGSCFVHLYISWSETLTKTCTCGIWLPFKSRKSGPMSP